MDTIPFDAYGSAIMPYDPGRHHRRSVRLPGFAYDEGTFFVTLCTEGRACLFGDVVDGSMRVNNLGRLVEHEWVRTGLVRPDVEIDVFGLMPNHLHGLVTLRPDPNDHAPALAPAPGLPGDPPVRRKRSLASIIAQFKASSTVAVNAHRGTPGAKLWQRGYHEHIVRDDDAFEAIAHYIVTNPERWLDDVYGPNAPLEPADQAAT